MRAAILMSLASPWSRDVATALLRAGIEVHVFEFDDSTVSAYLSSQDSFQRDAIEQFRGAVTSVASLGTAPAPLRYFTAAATLRKRLRECDADVLLTLYGGGFGLTAYLTGFHPYAIYAVGSDVLLAHGLRRTLAARALSAADAVFVNGGYLSDQVRELARQARIVTLLLGIDVRRFRTAAPPDTPVKILCTRGFLPVYNNGSLIDALPYLPAGVPDFQLTFVSTGPELASVRRNAEELPAALSRRVRFEGGVTGQQMQCLLETSHVFVSMSRSDGTSISLLEALACGLFPVLSDIPQNREWIDGENGILVPLDDPPALARALERAIVDADLRRRAAPRNRRIVQERASREANMTTLAEHLCALSGRSVAGAQVP